MNSEYKPKKRIPKNSDHMKSYEVIIAYFGIINTFLGRIYVRNCLARLWLSNNHFENVSDLASRLD